MHEQEAAIRFIYTMLLTKAQRFMSFSSVFSRVLHINVTAHRCVCNEASLIRDEVRKTHRQICCIAGKFEFCVLHLCIRCGQKVPEILL